VRRCLPLTAAGRCLCACLQVIAAYEYVRNDELDVYSGASVAAILHRIHTFLRNRFPTRTALLAMLDGNFTTEAVLLPGQVSARGLGGLCQLGPVPGPEGLGCAALLPLRSCVTGLAH
jgi:hypothetical protein